MFSELLLFKSKDVVDLQQRKAYRDITISKGVPEFSSPFTDKQEGFGGFLQQSEPSF
jgi:hypothetical protein